VKFLLIIKKLFHREATKMTFLFRKLGKLNQETGKTVPGLCSILICHSCQLDKSHSLV
jgi:hypothetical protein